MDSLKTILVIDDEANFREIFSMRLTQAGYRVEVAASGEEGIKKVQELKPDLVLLDVKMPGMGGDEVLSKLRENPGTSSSRIVFTTSLGEQGDDATDQLLAKKFGADGYISKAEDLDKFIEIVNGYIGSGDNKVGP